MPAFPSKKYVGQFEPRFIRIRAKNLTQFLNMFLALPLVKVHPSLPKYLKDKAESPTHQQEMQKLFDNNPSEDFEVVEEWPWNDSMMTEADQEQEQEFEHPSTLLQSSRIPTVPNDEEETFTCIDAKKLVIDMISPEKLLLPQSTSQEE